ncbi:hypothetical protein Poli38472_006621 [Pythium oligandrum]|uniref:Peptidase C1A papain C-terminal domain-containing protein n=1 Tax=Pythium oligandrum TaxID=41045 RepID=A0A8K1FBZ0_PYTOL|nr:hypothetical protein Poli38472_006621 [Pythium oligandrum]|eukprot:TMW56611.1 hypothetical protein Poli38472_006621 [Pythium oligandrum]
MASERSELPLLRTPHGQRRVLAREDVHYGSSATTDEVSWPRTRSLVQRVAPVLAWIAVGCGVSMLLQARYVSTGVVDYTHGGVMRHAVQQEIDLLAVCPNASASKNDVQHKPVVKNTGWFLSGPDPELIVTSIPQAKSIDELPAHWDWRDYNGTGISLVTSIQNQMVPKPCGSCWAFATTSALSDRFRIAHYLKYGKLGPEVVLSPQVLLDCGMRSFGSCTGGDPRHAHKWIHENGIVDTTCNPYIASHPSWMDSELSCGMRQCRQCDLNGSCKSIPAAKKYRISEYGTLNATTLEEFELEAMNEIYHRGPIVVSMYSKSPEYRNYQGGYVLRDSTKYPGTTHVVSLIGWGTDENGVKYWIVRNSDGTNWGEDGFFRAERGVNAYLLENHGAWAVPIV